MSQLWPSESRKYSKVRSDRQRQAALEMQNLRKVFVGNNGTVIYGFHHSPETILECMAMLAERNSLAAIHRIKGIKEETIMDWLRKAASYVEEVEAMLLANYHLNRVQLDAM